MWHFHIKGYLPLYVEKNEEYMEFDIKAALINILKETIDEVTMCLLVVMGSQITVHKSSLQLVF